VQVVAQGHLVVGLGRPVEAQSAGVVAELPAEAGDELTL